MSEILKTEEELENDYAFIFPVGNCPDEPEWKITGDEFKIFSTFDNSYETIPSLSTIANTSVCLNK